MVFLTIFVDDADPDPGGPKTYETYRSGSATLLYKLYVHADAGNATPLTA
jgi:hypothetical protein